MTLEDGRRLFGKIYAPQPGVHAGHRVLRERHEPRRRSGRRRRHRRGPGHGPDLLGHRRRPPRHKPANLLVKDGHLQLVDVSGLEVRPSPWRQAVDLSNMLLVLALRTDPERVYARATRVFTPDEIAEACASAAGLTIPTELQAKLKADGRPLLARLRQLAPPRDPISIQRWSPQRPTLIAAAFGVLLLAGLFLDSLRAGLT